MSDPIMRRRIRRGLLKSEEIHALARQVTYGKQGALMPRDLQAQRNTSNLFNPDHSLHHLLAGERDQSGYSRV